jgi:hypothetical protein
MRDVGQAFQPDGSGADVAGKDVRLESLTYAKRTARRRRMIEKSDGASSIVADERHFPPRPRPVGRSECSIAFHRALQLDHLRANFFQVGIEP